MKRWVRTAVAVTGAAAGAAAAAVAAATFVWNRQSEAARETATTVPALPGPTHYHPAELDGLPAPVVRYFQYALVPGQPLIRTARVRHTGQFRAGLDRPWGAFRSSQLFTVARPGFVWDARIRMAPMATAYVRDSYVDGRGSMRAGLAGLVTMVDQSDTPSLNSGALHRYLLESPWFPTALLPSQGVRWEEVDPFTARAHLSDGGITVSMDVHFDEVGRITRVEALRMRDVDGAGVPTPFRGRIWDYVRVDGMMVPLEGEVEWELPEGVWMFWRGRATELSYGYRGQAGQGQPRAGTPGGR
jgi:hypothetical protein